MTANYDCFTEKLLINLSNFLVSQDPNAIFRFSDGRSIMRCNQRQLIVKFPSMPEDFACTIDSVLSTNELIYQIKKATHQYCVWLEGRMNSKKRIPSISDALDFELLKREGEHNV